MKIKRIVKLKREMYDVLFDDGQSIKVHEESLVRYVLIPGKELDEEEFKQIVQNVQYDQAYVAAIKYISYKIRSNKEMNDYLNDDYEERIVSQTIHRLQDEGYLNDENYARSLRNTVQHDR
ncbi:RecX family transcriptional regulator [Jeotgalicoccus sp. WY2]|uniref:RecX family transcriptional regulator n=1 Tax=Jeotgalicoccus sp. WY2 TaxID=2708346 RepID=UPI001BD2C6E9|nr:RecX family transcriptional regulator [Jeotgalicoccus sp. WY2]